LNSGSGLHSGRARAAGSTTTLHHPGSGHVGLDDALPICSLNSQPET